MSRAPLPPASGPPLLHPGLPWTSVCFHQEGLSPAGGPLLLSGPGGCAPATTQHPHAPWVTNARHRLPTLSLRWVSKPSKRAQWYFWLCRLEGLYPTTRLCPRSEATRDTMWEGAGARETIYNGQPAGGGRGHGLLVPGLEAGPPVHPGQQERRADHLHSRPACTERTLCTVSPQPCSNTTTGEGPRSAGVNVSQGRDSSGDARNLGGHPRHLGYQVRLGFVPLRVTELWESNCGRWQYMAPVPERQAGAH